MLFCRRICNSDGSGVQFYLLVDVHEDAEDFEHGTSLDMQVTDGQSAWSQKGLYEVQIGGSMRSFLGLSPFCVNRTGLRRPSTQIADWMSVAKQALSEESDRFTFIITPKSKPDILRV